ncbi:MAG: S26 family signal peptidase [Dehalococcoidia bacterium]
MRYLAALTGLLTSGIVLVSFSLLQRYAVSGESMLPAFKPGDRLIAESWTYRLRAPRPGDVVVLRQFAGDGRKDLKRIVAGPGATASVLGIPTPLGPDEWYVLGDNLDASTDSRRLGPVQRQDILARVWFKY